jgi:geranylgeranyl diphosphate synthase, type I
VSEAELCDQATLVERGGGRRWAVAESQRRIGLADDALGSTPMPADVRDELLALSDFIVGREA